MLPDPTQEASKLWNVLPAMPRSPLCIRALPPSGCNDYLPVANVTFNINDFTSVDDQKAAFIDTALDLSQRGYNVYTTLNPVSPEFPGDLANGLAVKDVDIAFRHRLLIDLDRVNATCPATDDEIEASKVVADQIASYLSDRYGTDVYRVMSGNGHHLYLPLDNLPNDNVHKIYCQQLLADFAQHFDTPEIRVDRSVFNAARITKVPGTIARKGVEEPGRPFRMARVL